MQSPITFLYTNSHGEQLAVAIGVNKYGEIIHVITDRKGNRYDLDKLDKADQIAIREKTSNKLVEWV